MKETEKRPERLTSDKIIRVLEGHKRDIRGFGVKKIGLFGSFLRKNPRRRSDLDFLVQFENPTFDNYMELKFLLEKLFHRKVDLVIEENLKPDLRYVKEEAAYAKGL